MSRSRRYAGQVAALVWKDLQIERHTIAVTIGDEHHRSVERLDRIEVNQSLSRRAEHDAGQVVVLKHSRLLEAARRDEH